MDSTIIKFGEKYYQLSFPGQEEAKIFARSTFSITWQILRRWPFYFEEWNITPNVETLMRFLKKNGTNAVVREATSEEVADWSKYQQRYVLKK